MKGHSKHDNPRIIFPDFDWFDISSDLLTGGFGAEMTGAAFKRYVTLRYLANKNRSSVVQESLIELEKLDGISPRRAHEVNAHLGEMRMVEVNREANPYRYRLYLPTEWRKRKQWNSQVCSAPKRPEAPPWT